MSDGLDAHRQDASDLC